MARGKHLSLEEARKSGDLDRFAAETEYQQADAGRFNRLMRAMTSGKPAARTKSSKPGTSDADASED